MESCISCSFNQLKQKTKVKSYLEWHWSVLNPMSCPLVLMSQHCDAYWRVKKGWRQEIYFLTCFVFVKWLSIWAEQTISSCTCIHWGQVNSRVMERVSHSHLIDSNTKRYTSEVKRGWLCVSSSLKLFHHS